MSAPQPSRRPCGCCFIVPPSLLKSIALGHKVKPHDPAMFHESFDETVRLRKVREGHRVRAVSAAEDQPGDAAAAPVGAGAATPRAGDAAATMTTATATPATAAPDGGQNLFDCGNHAALPGQPVTDPHSASDAFKTIADTTARVARFYRTVLGRNSIDNRGRVMVSSLNYGRNYHNAFWNGEQMVYGNGDHHVFIDFWRSPDVIAHELTHGVTQNESALAYDFESGALNESLSDCFAAAFAQWDSGTDAADDKGWLMGSGIMGPESAAKHFTCLRDMVNPAAKHCLSPQPDSYADYDRVADVHGNSGIPNRAFATFARLVGGKTYDMPIKVWYAACTGGRLASNANFSDFAQSTVEAAARLSEPGKGDLADAARQAWAAVKVPVGSA